MRDYLVISIEVHVVKRCSTLNHAMISESVLTSISIRVKAIHHRCAYATVDMHVQQIETKKASIARHLSYLLKEQSKR